MKRIIPVLLVIVIVLSLSACGSSNASASSAAPAASESNAAEASSEPVVVRIGLTGAVYEPIWDVVKEKLAPEGIVLEYVQFNNFSLPNNALDACTWIAIAI